MTDFKLPDFEEMLGIADDIGKFTVDLYLAKVALDQTEASIIRTVMNNKTYWGESAKPPAFNYVEATFKAIGYDDVTAEALRQDKFRVAEISGALEGMKLRFQTMKEMVDVWKTQQFNIKGAEI